MSAVLFLEDFARPMRAAAPAEPALTEADLVEARAEGHAEGQAVALEGVEARAAAALETIAADLAQRAEDRADSARRLRPALAEVARAIASLLSERTLAARLADQIMAELAAILDPAGPPPVIACEPEIAALLAPRLEAFHDTVRVEARPGLPELTLHDSAIRIDVPAMLQRLNEFLDQIEGDIA